MLPAKKAHFGQIQTQFSVTKNKASYLMFVCLLGYHPVFLATLIPNPIGKNIE